MATLIQQIPAIDQLQSEKGSNTPSPKFYKKPTRATSNLGDIKTINATRYKGSPLTLADAERTIKTMAASQAASLKTPVKMDSSLSSSGSSITSYDSKFNSPNKAERTLSEENSPKNNYHTEGTIIIKSLEARFDGLKASVDQKNKPYFKVRLGRNTQKTSVVAVEGNTLAWSEDINVKFNNQDSIQIKVKGKGTWMDKSLARVKVSILDAVNKGKKSEWVPLMRGENAVGELYVEMEFQAKN